MLATLVVVRGVTWATCEYGPPDTVPRNARVPVAQVEVVAVQLSVTDAVAPLPVTLAVRLVGAAS